MECSRLRGFVTGKCRAAVPRVHTESLASRRRGSSPLGPRLDKQCGRCAVDRIPGREPRNPNAKRGPTDS